MAMHLSSSWTPPFERIRMNEGRKKKMLLFSFLLSNLPLDWMEWDEIRMAHNIIGYYGQVSKGPLRKKRKDEDSFSIFTLSSQPARENECIMIIALKYIALTLYMYSEETYTHNPLGLWLLLFPLPLCRLRYVSNLFSFQTTATTWSQTTKRKDGWTKLKQGKLDYITLFFSY